MWASLVAQRKARDLGSIPGLGRSPGEENGCELPDVQAGFRKGRGTRDEIANIHWMMEKAREFQKNIYFCFIDYAKAFDCGSQETVENSERDGNTGPPDLPLEKPVCRPGSDS